MQVYVHGLDAALQLANKSIGWRILMTHSVIFRATSKESKKLIIILADIVCLTFSDDSLSWEDSYSLFFSRIVLSSSSEDSLRKDNIRKITNSQSHYYIV